MHTRESNSMDAAYKSPSIKVIAASPEAMLCQSTEGYVLNDQFLDDDDFE